MKLSEGEYCCRIIHLPGAIHAAVRLSEDEFPNIYINDSLSPEAQKKAFLHEIRHIERGDFFNELPIDEIEGTA